MSSGVDAAEIVRQRLQADLRSALKQRASLEVSVLRSLIAAIDNAGAVALEPGRPPPRHEVERRHLGFDEIEAILLREYEARRIAAEQLARLGRPAESARANEEMSVVSRYLSVAPRD